MNTSLWKATTPETNFPVLSGTVEADVAIIGGGITGLTAALLLVQVRVKCWKARLWKPSGEKRLRVYRASESGSR